MSSEESARYKNKCKKCNREFKSSEISNVECPNCGSDKVIYLGEIEEWRDVEKHERLRWKRLYNWA